MYKSEFRILIADDDPIVRDVMVKFLADEGYPVVTANDGIAALKRLRLEDIKLVLTDLRMPGADGMEVLRAAVQMNPRISVVLLTAYGTLDTALEAMKEGAYDYIVKPFVMQQLLLVVRNAFRMAALMEENDKLSDHLKEIYRQLEEVRNPGWGKSGDAGQTAQKGSAGTNETRMAVEGHAGASGSGPDTGTDDGNLKKYNSLVNDLKRR